MVPDGGKITGLQCRTLSGFRSKVIANTTVMTGCSAVMTTAVEIFAALAA